MKMKNLMVRTLSGLVLVAVFVGAVLGSQWSFGALLLLILVGGQTEFYKLARETGLSPQRWMGLAVGVLLFALNFIVFRQFSRSVTDEAGGAVLYLLLYIGLLLPTLFVCELFRRSATPLANLGATLLGVLYVAVPLSLLERFHATENDAEDLSSLGPQIQGVDCAVTMRELRENVWKFSLRTGERVNATEVCRLLGGGGHARAAGATLEGVSRAEAEEKMLTAIARIVPDFKR